MNVALINDRVLLPDDYKRTPSDCFIINWSREELCEYFRVLSERKERLETPILPSSPQIFSF